MEENTFYHKYPGDIILTNQNYYYIRIYDTFIMVIIIFILHTFIMMTSRNILNGSERSNFRNVLRVKKCIILDVKESVTI